MLPTILQRPSPNHSPRLPGDPTDLIVLHSTVGTFDSSLGWLRNPRSGASSHYLISPQGDIVALVDESEQAWHAGVSFWRGRTNLNRYSIGIEITNRTGMQGFVGQDPYPEAEIEATTWLVQSICDHRRIPKDRQHIITHQEIAPRRKFDPIGFDMDELMRRIGGQAAPIEDDVYYVVPSRVNIRQGPATSFPIAAQAFRGQKLYIDKLVRGERLGGSDLWAHMKRMPPTQWDVGFVKAELLRRDNKFTQ